MKTGGIKEKSLPSPKDFAGENMATRGPGQGGTQANWRLPSGEGLAEFALHAGFLAPFLLPRTRSGVAKHGPAAHPTQRQNTVVPMDGECK